MSRTLSSLLTACALLTPATLSSQTVPEPMAYWNFDDNVDDQSGGDAGGTLMGGAGYSDDVPAALGEGSSLALSGDGVATDYVDLSAHVDNFAALDEGTISAWFKTPGVGVDTILAASDSADGSSELRLILERGEVWLDVREQAGGDFIDGALASPPGPNDDVWHHVVVTVEFPSIATMYIDGALAASTEEPFFSAVTELDTMSIGRNVDSGGAQWFFDGLIDDLAIWDVTLECDEIIALASGASPIGGEVGGGGCLPAAPTGVAAIGLDAAVFLNWNDSTNPDVAQYNIYRSLTPGGPYEPVGGSTESQYTEGGLSNGTTYYYTVTAIGANDSESLPSAEVQATPQAAGDLPIPFAYWPLDEGDGQVVEDLGPNGFDGFLGSTPEEDLDDPIWVEDVEDLDGIERAVALDLGGDQLPQWVDLSDHVSEFAPLDEGTISAWVKWPGGDVLDTILAASDSLDPSSELRFFYDTRPFGGVGPGLRYDLREDGVDDVFQISTPTDPGDDTWRHVAVTVDTEGNTAIYIDGVLEVAAREAGFFNAVSNLNTLYLGRNVDAGGSQWHFLGQLRDVAVWEEPLAAGAIAALAAGASPLGGGGGDEPRFKRGDVDGNGKMDITDPIAGLNHLFVGTFDPTCMDALDFDDNGKVDITDPIAGLTHLFGSGPPPSAPGKEECGPDPTADAVDGGDLGCESHADCDA